MTDNTPLNANDELLTKMRRLGEKYYGNELYGEHLQYQHELQELILANRNKHELLGAIKESERHIDAWGRERTKVLKQELESYE